MQDSEAWTLALILIGQHAAENEQQVCTVYEMRPNVETRRLVRDGRIVELFQGAYPVETRDVYRGDRELRDAPVTVQLHTVTLRTGDQQVVARDVKFAAIWMAPPVCRDLIVPTARHGLTGTEGNGGPVYDLRAARSSAGGFGFSGGIRRPARSGSTAMACCERRGWFAGDLGRRGIRRWGLADRQPSTWQICEWSTMCAAVCPDRGGTWRLRGAPLSSVLVVTRMFSRASCAPLAVR